MAARSAAPVFTNDARRVIAFEAVRYGLMSARSIVKLDTKAGKPSLTPLLWGSALLSLGDASVLFLVSCRNAGQFECLSTDGRKR
jgi:hypothetical protein